MAALGTAVNEAGEQRQPRDTVRVLRRPGMIGGMLATILIFSGHFAFLPICVRSLKNGGAGKRGEHLADPAGFGIANFIGVPP